MPIAPSDPNAAIAALAESVDKLSGQVAALTAYVAYLANTPIADKDVRSVQGLAQQLAPRQLSPRAGGAPALHASQGVERIQAMVQQLAAIRSAGSGTSGQPE